MRSKLRWGILSTGNIAGAFATALKTLPDAELIAVGSRSTQKADEFGAKYNIPRRYSSYEDLVADPDVQVVYIGTPHSEHMANTLLCLEAGKHVITEKPFTINRAQAQRLVNKAREKGLFLMEAMWTHFTPIMSRVREIITSGQIGEVRLLIADFGVKLTDEPLSRIMNPELGGGALLDVGIYPISLAQKLFGVPKQIQSIVKFASTGVDEQAVINFDYSNGRMASIISANQLETRREAMICGTKGWIKLPTSWWRPQQLTLKIEGQNEETINMPFIANGYEYEAMAAMQSIRNGELENLIVPWDETLAVMGTMDRVRHQWKFRYPFETDADFADYD